MNGNYLNAPTTYNNENGLENVLINFRKIFKRSWN